jgi:hypothetical protein
MPLVDEMDRFEKVVEQESMVLLHSGKLWCTCFADEFSLMTTLPR